MDYIDKDGNVVVYAGFWARFFAFLIDAIVLLIPTGIVVYLIDGHFGENSGWANLARIVIVWLYYSLQESGPLQATFGKRMLDIKVTDEFGRRISFGRATGRHFSKIISAVILFIGYIMAGFTDKKQALHDIIAGTLVVAERSFKVN